MQGPRKKEAAELAWSAIKRAATARVNYEAQVWREQRLNEELDKLWHQFEKALNTGEILGPDPRFLELGGAS